MKKQIWILILILAVIVVGVLIYSSQKPTQPSEKEVIKIGFIGALSGDVAAYGQTQLNSINLAVEEINQNRKQKIEVVAEDGKCSGKDAATAVQKLVDIDNVKIILGFTCSSELLSTVSITEPKKVIVFSSFSSNPQISDAGEYVFRNCPTDFDWAPYAAEIMYGDGFRKLAILSENTEFAVGAKNIIKNGFTEEEGSVVADELYEQNSKDYRTQITKIKAANPEVIFLLPNSAISAGLAAKQIREMGLTVPIYSTYVWTGKEAMDAAGKASEGIYFFDVPVLNKDNIKTTDFLSKYNSKYGAPAHDFLAALSYDTAQITEGGLKKCKEDINCLRDYLYSLKNYNGTAGIYSFNEKGDEVGISFVKKQIINGKPEIVE